MVTLYGIPKTLADTVRWAIGSPIGTVLWVTFISLLLVAIGYYLYLINPSFGGFFASAVFATLWSDNLRSVVEDIMLRRWEEL